MAVSERLRLEGELAQAIATRQLSVLYQPIFDLRDAPGVRAALPHLRGFEALVRWQRQDGEVLLPAGFLPIAKEAGLMRQVSDFVLHCASRQLRLWQCSHPDWAELTMGINLAADDLTDSTLVARVSRAIVEAGVRADHLTLELTEDILMGQAGGPADRLADLRRLGVRLAVDDFGTGYSNLGHLSRLAIDDLKIDGSLVRRMKPGSDDAAVVAAIVQLGTTLCKTVVAEGIETAEQIAQLQALGCAMGQGFYLSAPQPEQEISQWLAAGR